MSDIEAGLREIPGRPFSYYLRVLRRWWHHLLAGLIIGVLGGATLLGVSPPSATATAELELDIITSDPFGLDRAPSSLLDVGTEQQVARSYLVAEQAARDLGGALTPAQVLSSTSVSVRPQGTVMHVDFTASDAQTARSGADAVTRRFLEARGQKVEDRINDQLLAIQERLDELEEEQSQLSDEISPGGEITNLQESRQQSIRNEAQALVQQRTLLNSVTTAGGRVLTAGAVGEVTYSPSRSVVIAAGGMSGLLAALLFVFLLQGRSHRLVDMAEVEAHTTAPVLPERGPGGLAAAVVIAMLPVERRKMLVCNLGTQQDVERVVTALREAIARDPESDLQLVLLESGFQGEDPTLSVVRQVHEVVLIVNPRTTTTGELQQTLGILDLLDVSIIATVWSTSPRGGRASHKTQKSLRVLPRKGAA